MSTEDCGPIQAIRTFLRQSSERTEAFASDGNFAKLIYHAIE
jgi:hypothetical protein